MLTARDLLLGVVAPAVMAAAILRLARRPAAGAGGSVAAGGLAVALGYAVGHLGPRGIGPVPPVEASQWLPYLALGAAALCALEPLLAGRAALHRLGGLALLVAGLVLLLRAKTTYGWTAAESAVWLGALALMLLGLWLELEWVVPALPPLSGWIVLVVVCVGGAIALAASGSLLLGLLGGALAAACGGAAFTAALATGHGFERRSAIAPTVILAGLLAIGYFYSELPAASAALLAIAPLATKAVPRSLVNRRGAWTGALLHGAAAALPVALALGLALAASPPLEPYY